MWRWREAVAVRRGLRGTYGASLQAAVATKRTALHRALTEAFNHWARQTARNQTNFTLSVSETRRHGAWNRVFALKARLSPS